MQSNAIYEFNFGLLIKCISILISFVLLLTIVSLAQFPNALAQSTSGNVSDLINKGAALDSLGNHPAAIHLVDDLT